MRMEERMYRDPGTEPHSFFSKSSADWFPLQTGKVLFVWLMVIKITKTKKQKTDSASY